MSDSERAHSGVGGPVEISPRGPFGSDRVAFHAYSGGSAYQRASSHALEGEDEIVGEELGSGAEDDDTMVE